MKDRFIPDYDKTKIDGTFKEWIDSIAEEVKRLLTTKTTKTNEPELNCAVKVEKVITVYMNGKPMNHFSFTEKEFKKNRRDPKALELLLHTRFIDFLWELFDIENERLTFLRKFGIKYKNLNNVK
ncbi:hypothetical protein KAR91_41075 [Candidatus Pacearchaeota archaeon]|nr:hypothetical protein [Candidatus Pacearchaeota archaeon]